MNLFYTIIGKIRYILATEMNKNIKKGFKKSAFVVLLGLAAAPSIACVLNTTSNNFSINLLYMNLLILNHSHVHPSCVSPLGREV